MRKTLNRLYKKHRELILYGIIGVTGATLDFLVFLFLYNLLGLHPSIATALSVTTGIVNNFFLNAFFNFKKKDHLARRFFTFFTIGLFGLVLSVLLLYVLHDIVRMDANIAKIVSIPLVVILQYFFNKKYSFGASDMSAKQAIEGFLSVFFQHYQRNLFIVVAALSLIFGLMTSANGWFADEDDNILGGILINHDILPYTGFFSHHAPLTYFISAILTFFTGDNLGAFRIIFFLVIFTINILLASVIYKHLSKVGSIAFVVLTTILAPSRMLLAESLIAPLFLAALLVVFIPSRRPLAKTIWWLFGLFIVSSLLNPIYSSAYIVLGVYVLLRDRKSLPTLFSKRFIITSCLVLTVGIGIGAATLSSQIGQAFIEQYLQFNSVYYAPFSDYSSSLIALAATPLKVAASFFSFDWQFGDIFSLQGSFFIAWILGLLFALYHKKYGTALTLFIIMTITQIRALVYLPSYAGGAHHAIIWSYLSIAMLVIIFPLWYRSLKHSTPNVSLHQSYIRFVVFSLGTIALIGGVAELTRSAYMSIKTIYLQEPNTLITNREVAQNSRKYLSSLRNDETYWSGPLRFEAYFSRPTQSASKYMFYLPWHANCPACVKELMNDLRTNQPEIVLWEDSSIAGIPTSQYALPIYDLLAGNYIKSKNPKLSMYYFKNADIMQRVEKTL